MLPAPKDFFWYKSRASKNSFRETQFLHFLNSFHQTLKQKFSWYNLYHSLPDVSFLNLGVFLFASDSLVFIAAKPKQSVYDLILKVLNKYFGWMVRKLKWRQD